MMKRLALLCLFAGCGQGNLNQEKSRDCSIAREPNRNGHVISCTDGTQSFIPDAPTCRVEALREGNNTQAGVIVFCPPAYEAQVIRNGSPGSQGSSCVIQDVLSRNQKVLVCDGRNILVGI